ncbi:hypothetical protein [Rhodovulum sp. YEN HP10]|uniref:hypothetical protein n=1 Tax=Rhodovulum sp. HP10 TaxID=3387397 RepID=UPI0039E159B1
MGVKGAVALLLVFGLVFYLTLGAGLMTGRGTGPPDPENFSAPGWTGALDRLVAPFRPRLDLPQTRFVFTEAGSIELPRISGEAMRRASFAVEGRARLVYSCPGCDGDQVWPEEGTRDFGKVSFAVFPSGGRILVRPQSSRVVLSLRDGR